MMGDLLISQVGKFHYLDAKQEGNAAPSDIDEFSFFSVIPTNQCSLEYGSLLVATVTTSKGIAKLYIRRQD